MDSTKTFHVSSERHINFISIYGSVFCHLRGSMQARDQCFLFTILYEGRSLKYIRYAFSKVNSDYFKAFDSIKYVIDFGQYRSTIKLTDYICGP